MKKSVGYLMVLLYVCMFIPTNQSNILFEGHKYAVQSVCIDEEDIVKEFQIDIQIDAIQREELLDSSTCEYMKINYGSGPFVVALTGTNEKLSINELFSYFDGVVSDSEFFGQEIDKLDPTECVYSHQCLHPQLNLINSEKRLDLDIPLSFALDEDIFISEGDYVRVFFKTSYSSSGMRTYAEVEGLFEGQEGVCASRYRSEFLPWSINELSRVAWNCGGIRVYNFENVSALDPTNYTGTYSYGGKILNPSSEYELLVQSIDYIRGQNGDEDQCIVRLRNLEHSGADFSNWTVSGDIDQSDCTQDFDILSVSYDNSFMLVDADTFGVYVVNLSSKSSTRISSDGYDMNGKSQWLPHSNKLIYRDYTSKEIRIHDPTVGATKKILDSDFMDAFSSRGAQYYDYWMDMSNLFDDNTLFFAVRQGSDDFTMARFDFSNEYDDHEITTLWQGMKGGCEQFGPPALAVNIYGTTDFSQWNGTFSGCVPKIIVESEDAIVDLGRDVFIHKNLSIYCFSHTLGQNDMDKDTQPNDCDFDIDGDGINNGLDNCNKIVHDGELDLNSDGCFGDSEYDSYSDLDLDGVRYANDLCRSGYSNWSSRSYLFDRVYDNDGDGCHDMLEDLDDDNDGVLDDEDACPLIDTGHQDIDLDGLCEGNDLDDDGDNYSDLDEASCGSNSTNFSSLPSDIDLDLICDEIDIDMDGDNVSNDEDAFPFDVNEWNDLDSDGIGNNSDDCIGTYGTSYVDRLGCLDQDGDGVSDLNDLDPYNSSVGLEEYEGPRVEDVITDETKGSESIVVPTISVFALFIALLVIIRRGRISKNGETDRSNPESSLSSQQADNSEPTTPPPGPSSQIPSPETPAQSVDEHGYEWFTTPDGTYFYRTAGSGSAWFKFEN